MIRKVIGKQQTCHIQHLETDEGKRFMTFVDRQIYIKDPRNQKRSILHLTMMWYIIKNLLWKNSLILLIRCVIVRQNKLPSTPENSVSSIQNALEGLLLDHQQFQIWAPTVLYDLRVAKTSQASPKDFQGSFNVTQDRYRERRFKNNNKLLRYFADGSSGSVCQTLLRFKRQNYVPLSYLCIVPLLGTQSW